MDLKAGDRIEVFTYRTVGGDECWMEYEVLDWEEPRRTDDGRWKFTASRKVGTQLGPSPMMVSETNIRKATA